LRKRERVAWLDSFATKHVLQPSYSRAPQYPFLPLEIAGGLIGLGLLMMLWLYWQQGKQEVRASAPALPTLPPERFNEEDDGEGEYDFMNTDEALPAKLDLARAYIQMEDIASARSILQDVLEHGDEVQQQEAQSLLAQIDPDIDAA